MRLHQAFKDKIPAEIVGSGRQTPTYPPNHFYLDPRMVREEVHGDKTIYICECGLGFDDPLIAFACEEYRRTRGINSEEIVRKAVYNPRSEPTKRTVQAH